MPPGHRGPLAFKYKSCVGPSTIDHIVLLYVDTRVCYVRARVSQTIVKPIATTTTLVVYGYTHVVGKNKMKSPRIQIECRRSRARVTY